MKLYVDGNDLLEAFREAGGDVFVEGDPHSSRLNLARWLARYAESSNCDVELVFDENAASGVLPPVERHGRVSVSNLAPGAQALHEIAGPANRAAQAGRVLVVTADPRLVQALAGGGARVLEPRRFLRRVRARMRGGRKAEGFDEPDEKFSGLSDEEVGFWTDFFQADGE